MKRYLFFIIAFIILLALAAIVYLVFFRKAKTNSSSNNQASTSSIANSSQSNQTPTSTSTPTPAANQPAPTLVYPITQFADRITTNDFGQHWPAGGTTNPDIKVCPKATYYVGFHTANDLETFANEQNTPVPVYAIAAGTVKEAGPVSGYGGLIVLESTINGSVNTIYYGHIDLGTKTVTAGDSVSAGQKIAELGPACSPTNGNVRKHLHFGMHKGTAVDVKGYVPSQSDLSAWTDPNSLLSSLNASPI